MNGAQLLIACLENEGVKDIWGYPGGAIMPVYDALLDSSIKHYLTRHEQGAGFAAQGAARSTNRTSVCMATSGPGATNLITAIGDAYMDSIPMVVITGQVPSQLMGTDAFQELDVFGMCLPITKHSYVVKHADDIPRIVREAFELAGSGKLGPVLIDFPKDIAFQKTEAQPLQTRQQMPPISHCEPEALRIAKELLAKAECPLIYAGGGVEKGNAVAEFRAFVETTGIPVVHTLHGLGCLPGNHPQFLGMVGMHGSEAANKAVQGCDLLLAIGSRFDDRATGKLTEFAPRAKAIHVNLDPAEFGKLRVVQSALGGDVAQNLVELTMPLSIQPWIEQTQVWKQTYACRYDAPFDSVFAPRLLHDLSQAMTDKETFVCCDVGQHQMWVAQHYKFTHPKYHLTSGGAGTMGFGLPAALGVQQANPDARTIVVSGDGSIMMNIQELATIKRYNIPVKILLFDNQALGMVRQWQQLFFNNRESEIDLSDNPDFCRLAEAFGIPSMRVVHRDQEADVIHALKTTEGPLFIHTVIDRAANVWPLVPPGASNSEMMTEAGASVG
jgi:acetolactate synthase-1/2/3 large subunit